MATQQKSKISFKKKKKINKLVLSLVFDYFFFYIVVFCSCCDYNFMVLQSQYWGFVCHQTYTESVFHSFP